MTFPRHIFKAYDIRGIAGEELTEELFYRIGRASIVYTDAKTVYVGADMRNSSEALKNALIRGLSDQGANVVDIGLVSTPMLNVVTLREDSADLGIMITASHNPAEYNGCKFVNKRNMMPIGLDSGLDQIRDMVEKYDFVDVSEKGEVGTKDLHDEYIAFTRSLIDLSGLKPLKLVVDMGNGIEGVLIDKLLQGLPIEAEYLYKEPDGNFPNHEANPLKYETLKDLQKKVVDLGANVGFAFDADADRVGLVDEKGNIVPGDKILAILATEILKNNSGGSVLYDVRCTKSIPDAVVEAGGRPIEVKVGRTLIIQNMRKENAVLGGELSAHFYYKDLFGFESGDLTLLYILKIISEAGLTLSELTLPYNKYFHSGEINFKVEEKDQVLAKLEENYKQSSKKSSKLDGLKMDFEDWWFSVRKSNTESLLRLVLEASSEKSMTDKIAEISDIIEKYN
ncbi:MAG: phosphomannomutase/phosphoglucomutase [bacterium]|nr:phosphomannomutase/phosphoglucomutase [bacterium]